MNRLLILLLTLAIAVAACHPTEKQDDKKLTPVEKLTRKIAKEPGNAALYIQRADLFHQMKDYNKALTDVQKAVQLEPDSLGYMMKLANLFYEANQVQGTINTLNAILLKDPKNVQAHLKFAELNLIFKRYAEVFKHVDAVIEEDPFNARAFFIRGYTYKEKGDTNRAVRAFMEAVKNNPQFYEANDELGLILMAKKDPLAENYFKNAIEGSPGRVDAYYHLGLFYQNNDELNKAQDIYRKINEIDPNFPYAYYNIGYILLEISRTPDEAKKYFAQAIKAKPDYYEAHFNLGLCFEETGDLIKAQECYQNALKYNHNYDKAIEGLNRIDNIMKRQP